MPIAGLKTMTLSDVDFDGGIDIVYMKSNEINVIFNKFSKDSDHLC